MTSSDGIPKRARRRGLEVQRNKKVNSPQPFSEKMSHDGAANVLAPVLGEILTGLRDIRAMLARTRKEFYTVEEVAELTGRTPYTVRRWIKEKRISATRVIGTGPRGRLLLGRDQLDRLIGTGLGGEITESIAE